MAPGGGGGPDFTRRGTKYLHTPLLKKYPKSKSLDFNGMFFGFSAPKIGGVLMKTFSKPSFTHFFDPTTDHSCPKNAVLGKKNWHFWTKKCGLLVMVAPKPLIICLKPLKNTLF